MYSTNHPQPSKIIGKKISNAGNYLGLPSLRFLGIFLTCHMQGYLHTQAYSKITFEDLTLRHKKQVIKAGQKPELTTFRNPHF